MENTIEKPLADSVAFLSEDFVYNAVATYLKNAGYKVQKETAPKEGMKQERTIHASKFFKKEIIEVRGFNLNIANAHTQPAKTTAKSWFSDAMLSSFMNFGTFDSSEIAMALPNVGRYQAIVEKLHEYFTTNDLYFRIYLVNEDGSVEVSNLNEKYMDK